MTAVAHRSYGLPAALLRHSIVVVLVAGAVIGQGKLLSVAIGNQPWSWLAVAIGVGALAAIVARSVIGAVFVVIGFALGLFLLLTSQVTSAADAGHALANDSWLYGAMLAAALEAYLVVMLVVARLRR